jgi:3-hydroxybutyryl-CoA dehydrogenase
MAKVTVIGSGLMGSGIAQVTSLGGWDVTLIDTDKGALERARAAIRGSLDRFVAKEKVTAEDAEAAQSRITVSTDLDEASGSKIVVEAVFERLAVKQEVFRALSGICSPETVLATNTSAIPITEIAAAATHPERVVGTHFFSPVPMMQLCELVRGIHTSDEALDTARRFAESAGKTCVVVNRDVAGFATTRLICAFVNEAARLVEDGVISAEDLDTACRLGFGHPMGPLATADLTGIDVITHATENIYEDTADPQFFPPALLRRLVAAGEIGRKSGKGFFDYSELSTGLWIQRNGADPQVRAVCVSCYFTTSVARAGASTFSPPLVTVIASSTEVASSLRILPSTTTSAPPSAGTTTGFAKRAEKSVRVASIPAPLLHSRTARETRPIVYMPWAITSGSPAALAAASSWWIGFWSPEASA